MGIDVVMPSLASLGATPLDDTEPYFIGVQAQDIAGHLSALVVQQITIRKDRRPTAVILSPVDGSSAVEGTQVPVVINAEDDVGIFSVSLTVNGQPFFPILYGPPYQFLVPVTVGMVGLDIQATAMDTAGNPVSSQQVHV